MIKLGGRKMIVFNCAVSVFLAYVGARFIHLDKVGVLECFACYWIGSGVGYYQKRNRSK